MVYLIDECHLLWGDVCGYGWGLTKKAMQQGNRGGSAVLGRQRGLGGSPHEGLPFPQRLPWFPRGLQGADAGSAHRTQTMSDCIKTRLEIPMTNERDRQTYYGA
ncbi:MAG: hypothetical protein F6K55_18925 [Moorea sp. SIO4A3]|nr:hypothetical protein [Moorena sp. SIO4A3]